jgi:hypothetical protein
MDLALNLVHRAALSLMDLALKLALTNAKVARNLVHRVALSLMVLALKLVLVHKVALNLAHKVGHKPVLFQLVLQPMLQ